MGSEDRVRANQLFEAVFQVLGRNMPSGSVKDSPNPENGCYTKVTRIKTHG